MRDIAGFTAGATRMHFPLFAAFAYLGGFIWPVCYVILGYYVGEGWHDASVRMRQDFELAAEVFAGLLALYLGIRYLRHRLGRHAKEG